LTTDPPDSPIRLAFCITELEVGGAERCLVELATRLDRAKFSPVVYSLGPRPTGEQATLVLRLEEAGVPVHFLNGRTRLAAPAVLWKLTRLLRTQNPHIVQTFLFHANLLGTLAARLAGVRCVVTGIRVAERRKAWRLRWAKWLDGLVTRHVCVSQSVADFSAAVGGLATTRLIVIPNGVDLERFRNARPCSHESLGVGPNRRLIVFIGRLDAQKGPDLLLELAPEFLSRLPDHDLVFVGRGPLRESLEARSRQQAEGNRIHFAGWRADVPEILAAADLVALPSQWEGMPNVLLEAMAAGKPVVATNVEGATEVLAAASAGQLVSHGSQAICESIVAIASQPEAQSRMGRENRCVVEQDYTLEAAVSRYARLYEALAADQFQGL
jgi:starch synthase (maltosyl-transferring)